MPACHAGGREFESRPDRKLILIAKLYKDIRGKSSFMMLFCHYLEFFLFIIGIVMSLVGSKAPDFIASAVINGSEITEKFSLKDYIGKKEVLLFFYPKDFTYICPTEIIAFQEYLEEFKSRNVAVIGCSTDTEETHLAWLKTPLEMGGIEGVTYPIIADASKTIAANFGVLAGNWSYDDCDKLKFEGIPVAYRATFLIDKEGIVRHQTVNDLPIGRNIEEMLRIVDMWHHVQKHGEVCPANWNKGKRAMKPDSTSLKEYMASSGCCSSSKTNTSEESLLTSKDSSIIKNDSGCCGGGCGSNNSIKELEKTHADI